MTKPQMSVVHGAGQIVEMLSDALRRAEAGDVDVAAVVLCVGSEVWINVGKVEGAPYAWARLTSGATWLEHHLMANEL